MASQKYTLKSTSFIVLLALAISILVGCRPHLAPVVNVTAAPIYSPPEKPLTLEGVRAVIRKGVGDQGWHIDKEEPGKIWASIQVEEHSATVLVEYDLKCYSITHVESGESFKYHRRRDIIHRRYNNWIYHLNNSINAAFYQ